MIAVLLRELKDRRMAMLAYCFTVIALLVIYMSVFPSVHTQMEQFQKLYESYPKGLYRALGIENLSVSTLENYLAIEQFSIVWPVLAILFSASLAGASIAGQIEKGMLGFYLALPLRRLSIYGAKFAAGAMHIAIFTAVSVLGIAPLAALFHNTVSLRNLCSLSIVSLLFALAVYAFALFLSACFNERSKAYMLTGGMLILMYVANVVAELKTSLSWLAKCSIFHYYNAQDVISSGHLQYSSLAVFAAALFLFTLAGALVFHHRNITV